MIRGVFVTAAFALLLCAVVVPNSMPVATAALLVACGALSLVLANPLRSIPSLAGFYAVSAIVSLIYLIVGQIQNAPVEAASQVAVIYLISPLLWLSIAAALLQSVDERRFVRWLHGLSLLSLASIAIYFILFATGGPDAVRFFIASANVNLQDGYAGATMFVYGSLIFLCAGYFAAPEVVESIALRILLLLLLPIAALTSGRGALIMSIPIGLMLGAALSRRRRAADGGIAGALTANPMFLSALGLVAAAVVAVQFDLNLGLIAGRFVEEVDALGGRERAVQAQALLEGVLETFGAGAGHGIGVGYVRSETFPWRYEMVGLATLYRVGFAGALAYLAPFIAYGIAFYKRSRSAGLDSFDVFMFAGLAASLFAANTNPYIEAFSFQWMFVFPLVALEIKTRADRSGVPRFQKTMQMEGFPH